MGETMAESTMLLTLSRHAEANKAWEMRLAMALLSEKRDPNCHLTILNQRRGP